LHILADFRGILVHIIGNTAEKFVAGCVLDESGNPALIEREVEKDDKEYKGDDAAGDAKGQPGDMVEHADAIGALDILGQALAKPGDQDIDADKGRNDQHKIRYGDREYADIELGHVFRQHGGKIVAQELAGVKRSRQCTNEGAHGGDFAQKAACEGHDSGNDDNSHGDGVESCNKIKHSGRPGQATQRAR